MPSQTRVQSTTSATSAATTTTPQHDQEGGDNTFLAALLSGQERLDGEARDYLNRGISFQQGMRGELVKRIQEAAGVGADGAWGPKTTAALQKFQVKHGLPDTGVCDLDTWLVVAQNSGSLKTLRGEDDFARLWAEHPHNYLADESENTSSEALRDQLGMTEAQAQNTCALRMSVMLNRMGGDMALTTNKGREAGLHNMRQGGLYMPQVKDPETENQNDRVILSAREMWAYLEKHRGKPDVVWPPRGRYKTQEEAEQGAKEVEASCAGRKGFIAFDKIFGYGGSGHVDLFDGAQLSDGSFYAAERTMIWYVV